MWSALTKPGWTGRKYKYILGIKFIIFSFQCHLFHTCISLNNILLLWLSVFCNSLVQSRNAVRALQIKLQVTSFSLGLILQKRADDQFSFMTKCRIYYIKHLWMQLFSMGVDWSEIVCFMEVSALLYKCTYCVLLCTTELYRSLKIN